MDQVRFAEICLRYRESNRARSGIGTLGEKTLHAVLKNYFEPNSDYHEVKVDGYFADIAREGEIFEIQTRDLYRLAPKISTFIVENQVTVVFPIAMTKKIFWMHPDTGECLSERKSSKKGKEIDVLPELYGLRDFLLCDRFRVCLLLMDVNEYRIPDGQGKDRKKHATKLDRYPVALIDEIYLETAEDYRRFLPENLLPEFSSSDFRIAAKCDLYTAQISLNILSKIGVIETVGKKGRYKVYRIAEIS